MHLMRVLNNFFVVCFIDNLIPERNTCQKILREGREYRIKVYSPCSINNTFRYQNRKKQEGGLWEGSI